MQEGKVHPPSWHLVIKNAEIPTLFLHGKQIAFQITVAQALMWWSTADEGHQLGLSRVPSVLTPCSHHTAGWVWAPEAAGQKQVQWEQAHQGTAQLPAPPQRAQGCFKSCLLNGERGRAPLTALLHPGGLPLWRHHSAEQLWAEGRPISTAFYPCQTHKHSNEPNWF